MLHHLTDAEDPAGITARLLAPTAPGSYLVISHLGQDLNPARAAAVARAARSDTVTLVPRPREAILRCFAGVARKPPA